MQLNLPVYEVKIREDGTKKKEIFDTFRKKYVRLTPEEWVRQHFLHFLCNEMHYPASLINVEKSLEICPGVLMRLFIKKMERPSY